MASTIRWGILGCGRIARKFASDLARVQDASLLAVASRSLEQAHSFAREFPAKYVHGSYLDLALNPEVDVIYIATPHGLHHEHTLLCIEHGKAVLCEKAFAINLRQAKEMIAASKKKQVFLMEALWTKFSPHFILVNQMIKEGKLGEIQSLLVNFGFIPQPPIPERLYDPALGGGTLLDIGIYNVFLALSVLGKPDKIEASRTPALSGVDKQCAVLFSYPSGAFAQLFSTFCSNLATDADINGLTGRLRLNTRFYEPGTALTYYPGRPDTAVDVPYLREPGFGYQYEARHVGECLRMGLTESPVMSHTDSLDLMETLDRIREVAGIRYDADKIIN
jgi:predicted dehydrogenase